MGTLSSINLAAILRCFRLVFSLCSFLSISSRELAESSPYFEALKADDVEVLFTYDENDEVVFAALQEFQKKKIVSAENSLMKSDASAPSNADNLATDSNGILCFFCFFSRNNPKIHFFLLTKSN